MQGLQAFKFNDRYRGVTVRRDILFVHGCDLTRLGFSEGDKVDVVSHGGQTLFGLTVVAYPIAKGFYCYLLSRGEWMSQSSGL